MASRPSAFDLLMSNASKKKSEQKQQKSSPKKRKTPTPIITSQNSAPISVKEPDSAQIKEAQLEKDMKNDDSSKVKDAQLGKSEEAVVKKPKVAITPDESFLELKDKVASFDPKKAAYWGKGQRVPFMFVAKALDAISKESGQIAITAIVCNMLRTVMETTPEDLVAVVYLLANRIAPAHEGLELGIGDASIIKALSEACGTKEAQIKKQYKELGDLGLVAKASRSSQSLMRKPEALTVVKVFDTFRLIAKESGKDSQEKKKNHIKALLVAATDCEPQYLIRLLQAAKIVKQVYSVIPVYDKIIPALLADGVWDLPKTCSFSPGVPVGPMLAKPTKGVSEILDKFQDIEFTCEYKYDGERAQIHYMEDGTVEIYSRNAERNTGKYPDVVDAISRFKRPSVTSFVLDCEIVAFDREKKKILPFQVLSTRARKNVVLSEIKVGVCIYAFDILYINGQPLLQAQLDSRRQVC
ncbi:DNA ligase 1-like isoform X1 [Coffea arabica]|uniref:DNA ligase 1-like isoform X1 n=1 Tax=Coffea arabica TaxID=13443 RepID=A0ABM4VNU0_COFAR